MTTCPAGVSWPRLVDYWAGDAGADEAEWLEEHFFACEACTRRLERIRELGAAIVGWARRQMRGGMSPELLEQLRADRVAVREYSLPAGGSVSCTARPDDDVVVLRLAADLSGVRRADVEFRSSIAEVERAEDVPIVGEREVIFAERADFLRPLPAHRTAVRLLAVDEGGERILASYTLNHTPYT